MASQQVTLEALGLNYSPNTLTLPQGSLVQADDVIIRRDNVVESRRGYREYSEGLGISTDRAKQLIEYKERVLVHYSNKLAFDTLELDANGKSIFNDFNGTFLETQAGLRIKSIEANKNLYFTTSEGIKKISAKTAADFTTASGFVRDAGAVKALDISGILDVTQGQLSGFLPNDSSVAYRAVWGYKDRNENLLLGTPSNRIEIFNYLTDVAAMDLNAFNVMLDILDQSTSLITDGDYATSFYTPSNSDASALLNNTQQLAIKLDQDIHYANTTGAGVPLTISTIDLTGNKVTVTFTTSDVLDYFSINDWVEFTNLNVVFADINNNITNPGYTLDFAPTATTISFTFVHANIASGTPTTGDIYSYNYRHITATGDDLFASPLDTLILSSPPTSEQVRTITNTLSRMLERLKVELSGVIPTTLETIYVAQFVLTERANTIVTVTIPTSINSDYFVQIYRTRIFTATDIQTLGSLGGVSVIPDDEMRLVYEAFPTLAEIAAGELIFNDSSPEELVQNNTNLYTNPETGEGLIAANEPPPFAKDINRFKNVVFYANTRTKQRLTPFQLLGVSNISTGDKITITSANGSDTYTFVLGVKEITRIDFIAAAGITDGDYFNLYSANDDTHYIPYYVKDNAIISPPSIPNTKNLRIDILGADTAAQVALKTLNTINELVFDFNAVSPQGTITSNTAANPTIVTTSSPHNLVTGDTIIITGSNSTPSIDGPQIVTVTGPFTFSVPVIVTVPGTSGTFTYPDTAILVTNINEGITTATSDGASPTGFTFTEIQAGDGEDATLKQVLLSSLTSAAQAIEQTAQSLVRVINKQTTSIVNGFYISGENSPPGQINLEEKDLSPEPFYVIANNSNIGFSFNPDISPVNTDITSISIAAAAVVTTSNPHGLLNGDQIVITNTDSTPSIDGLRTVTVLSTTTFSVPVTTTVVGTMGSWSTIADTIVSTNEIKPNRVYYSKLGQPEAVPILNYFDISAEDKEILRIFPLRDTLFAFKQDGTYRISGEIAPWSVSLLDSSCIVVAPDSVAVTNNIVYAWTSKGITPVTETGAGQEVSRPVDTEVLRLSSSTFTNFSTLTWGVGYDSDSSYTVYTNSLMNDETASIAFRYCTLTNTWTNFIREQTCGLNLVSQDVLYMGSGFSNLIHKERKEFNRKDYADKDFVINLASGHLSNEGRSLSFTSVTGINVGDVITQEQTLTTYGFNSLLRQLDNDPTVGINSLTSSSGASTLITITTAAPHQLTTGNFVTLASTDSYPSLDGLYQISAASGSVFNITIATPLLVQASTGQVKRNYENTLESISGDNMRDDIVALAAYLDTDTGTINTDYSARIATTSGTITINSIANPTVITTSGANNLIPGRIVTIGGTQTPASIPSIIGTFTVSGTGIFGSSTTFTIPKNVTTAGGSGLSFDTGPNLNSFEDIKASFNDIVSQLNNDSGATYSNYQQIDDVTLFEAVVLTVNKALNKLTVNLPLQWVIGPMTVYNAINCQWMYAPITMGDALMSKQISDFTIMLNNKAITKITASFSSDLKPEFTEIDFFGQGNGIFGHYSEPGFGFGFFGGASNSAPFRSYVPAQNQRCRYLNMQLTHKVARENWALYGTTLNGTIGISNRTYR